MSLRDRHTVYSRTRATHGTSKTVIPHVSTPPYPYHKAGINPGPHNKLAGSAPATCLRLYTQPVVRDGAAELQQLYPRGPKSNASLFQAERNPTAAPRGRPGHEGVQKSRCRPRLVGWLAGPSSFPPRLLEGGARVFCFRPRDARGESASPPGLPPQLPHAPPICRRGKPDLAAQAMFSRAARQIVARQEVFF